MTLTCNASRVIIEPDPEHQASQIVIPQKLQGRPSDRGTVIAVGPGRRHIDGKIYPLETKVGDRVIFSLVRSLKFEFEGRKLVLMDEDEVFAFIRPDQSSN